MDWFERVANPLGNGFLVKFKKNNISYAKASIYFGYRVYVFNGWKASREKIFAEFGDQWNHFAFRWRQ